MVSVLYYSAFIYFFFLLFCFVFRSNVAALVPFFLFDIILFLSSLCQTVQKFNTWIYLLEGTVQFSLALSLSVCNYESALTDDEVLLSLVYSEKYK